MLVVSYVIAKYNDAFTKQYNKRNVKFLHVLGTIIEVILAALRFVLHITSPLIDSIDSNRNSIINL